MNRTNLWHHFSDFMVPRDQFARTPKSPWGRGNRALTMLIHIQFDGNVASGLVDRRDIRSRLDGSP